MADPIDYQAVLVDLETKRAQAVAQFDAAIAAIRLMANLGVPDGAVESAANGNATETSSTAPRPRQPGGNPVLENDTFFGLSTAGAVKKFLGLTKRPQSPRAIADALMAGGQVHAVDEKAAYVNVYSALKKMRVRGETVQIKSGDWGLAEWYGNKAKVDGE